MPNISHHVDMSETNALLIEVKKAVDNIPGTNLDVDGLGNLIITKVRQGVKEVTKFKQPKI